MAQIKVTVVEGRNLKKKDLNSDNDPFVQIYLDDSGEKLQTTAKYNACEPKWNEVLVFNHSSGQDQLHIDVYDQDYIKNRKTKASKIGSTTIDLHDLYQKQRIDDWFTIVSRICKSNCGEIHLILEYLSKNI